MIVSLQNGVNHLYMSAVIDAVRIIESGIIAIETSQMNEKTNKGCLLWNMPRRSVS